MARTTPGKKKKHTARGISGVNLTEAVQRKFARYCEERGLMKRRTADRAITEYMERGK